MLYVCVGGVMDVMFSVYIVTRGAVRIRIPIFWIYIYDMAMKRKFIIYAPGNRNYGYCRLHFGYQIIIFIYIYI